MPASNYSDSSSKKSYRVTDNLAEDLSLNQGQLVRANVVSLLPEEHQKLIVTIRGQRVVARSGLDVRKNQTLLARVESLSSPIELNLIDPENTQEELNDSDLKSFLEHKDFPNTSEDVDLFKEWLDQSLPLQDDLLQEVFDNKNLVSNESGEVQGDKLWAMSFMSDEDFPTSSEAVGLLAEAKGADFEKDLNAYLRSQGTVKASTQNEFSLKESIKSVGFDVVRQFSRLPHTASQRLHSQLLKQVDESSEENSETVPLGRRILGLILGIALMNVREESTFTIFVPVHSNGQLNLIWMSGGKRLDGSPGWFVDCQASFSKLGRMGIKCSLENNSLKIIFRSTQEKTRKKLKLHQKSFSSRLKPAFEDVKLIVRNEEPEVEFDPFSTQSDRGNQSNLSFQLGLDFTI